MKADKAQLILHQKLWPALLREHLHRKNAPNSGNLVGNLVLFFRRQKLCFAHMTEKYGWW